MPEKLKIRECTCGKRDGVEVQEGKAAFTRYFCVACKDCGRKTAKHTGPEEAIREWNHMEDGNEYQ